MRQRTIPQMKQRAHTLVLNRRDFVAGAGAAGLLVGFCSAAAGADVASHSVEFKHALAQILNGATPQQGGIDMDLPETVENGNYVPLALEVQSPMTPENHVKAIHLLSTANPRAHVATFHFTLLSGKARVTSRMRLAKTQEVVAVAALSDGTFLMSTRTVDVKIGGCGI
jgi:sulfur-oxidizing protein SoxY